MRCEIVGSLLHRPSILFLDEPTIGLDVVAKQRIRQHIRELNEQEGTTVFLTSHDAGDVEQLCQRVVMINHGKVVFDDSVAALRQGFLKRKRIELKLLEPMAAVRLPGVTTVRHDDYELVVEIDTSCSPGNIAVTDVRALPGQSAFPAHLQVPVNGYVDAQPLELAHREDIQRHRVFAEAELVQFGGIMQKSALAAFVLGDLGIDNV